MGQTAESTRYEIRFSQPRARRGRNAWGVFERESETFSHCVIACFTEAEAKAALADLTRKEAAHAANSLSRLIFGQVIG